MYYYVAYDDNANTVYVPQNERQKPSYDTNGALEFSNVESAYNYAKENVVWEFWIEDENGNICS